MTQLDSFWFAVAATVLGAAWVAVTLIGRLCRHEWEVFQERKVFGVGYDGVKLTELPIDFQHQLRCVKCGELKFVSEGLRR